MTNLESITTREFKCVWKTKPSNAEEIKFNKNNIYHSPHCKKCMGYKKDCPDYIRRIILYTK
jgi:hypothetical protein